MRTCQLSRCGSVLSSDGRLFVIGLVLPMKLLDEQLTVLQLIYERISYD